MFERFKPLHCLKRFQKKKKRKSEWFDKDCYQAKKESRRKLRLFRKSRSEEDRILYVESRKMYKLLLKNKKRTFRKEKADALTKEIHNSAQFWKQLRNMGYGGKDVVNNNISVGDWFEHFKKVFQSNSEDNNETSNVGIDISEDVDSFLNKPISKKEVADAINNLKIGKACGIDGVTAEMLKAGGEDVEMFLTILFNTIFDKGVYPKEWAKAIIVPIHKKGDHGNVDNYRGVSLLSIISKCFTSILNTRLSSWLETNELISDCQAGFCKSHSTIDHIFTLYAVVQKCMSKKGRKLYVAFVDFKKSFDSVRHNKLLECMKDQGVNGKFFVCLKGMYYSLLSCVRYNHELSEMFECPIGVRQGCSLSPTLFSMFMNQLSDQIKRRGKHGVQLSPDMIELFILLFADDVALLSTTPSGLQNQLNILQKCCDEMKLYVNIDKTKIMVFRKGGFLGRREKWFYRGERLEVVQNYCYLGFNFTTKVSVKKGTMHLAAKGKKATVQLCRVFQKYKEMSPNTFFKIFDVKIQPVLLYSSEVWGLHRLDSVEKVHLMACKRFLGVPIKSPNKMVYGDLGRYPLYINAYVSCLRYWFRILQMEKERLPYKAYLMLLNLDNNGKNCWASKVRMILCDTGFNVVWLQQSVGNVKMFLRAFKQRLVDLFIQEWDGSIRHSDRYDTYRSFKTLFEKEKYVYYMDMFCFRAAITQLRFNVLPLNNNMHRYSESIRDKHCKFCRNKIENEKHFLFECSAYDDLRTKFLKDSAELPMDVLLTSTNMHLTHDVSRFVFHAMKRKNLLKL